MTLVVLWVVGGTVLMDLDRTFGYPRSALLPARSWEGGTKPDSRCRLDVASGRALFHYVSAFQSPLFKHECDRKLLIWAMDETGNVWIAFEETASGSWDHIGTGYAHRKFLGQVNPRYDIERKLGHPTLLGGGKARIAGEFSLVQVENDSIIGEINGSSGRYCKGLNPVPTIQQLKAVAEKFTSATGMLVLVQRQRLDL